MVALAGAIDNASARLPEPGDQAIDRRHLARMTLGDLNLER